MRNTPYLKMFPHAGTRSLARAQGVRLRHQKRAPIILTDDELRVIGYYAPGGPAATKPPVVYRVTLDSLEQKGLARLTPHGPEVTPAGQHVAALMRGEYVVVADEHAGAA